MRRIPGTLWLLAALLAIAACSPGGTAADARSPSEVLPDASEPEPGTDPGIDPGTDPSPDAAGDLGPETGDVPTEPGSDAAPDTPDASDATPDAPDASDAAPDAPDASDTPPEPPDLPADDGPPAPTFAIVEGGQSAHAILLEATASASEQWAAQEIQAYVEQATGARLPIVSGPNPGGPVLVVGQGENARALGVDPGPGSLGEQGFAIRAIPPNVVIAGTAAAGTMYGAHRFLEDFVGVRWLAPGVTRVPASPDLRVPEALDRTARPAFEWRSPYYTWPGGDAAFLAHQAANDGAAGPDSPTGAQHWNDGQCHTYFQFVSPEEFFDSHPEYFSEIGGVRVRTQTQLCLTNPDVLDIVTERMLARMAAYPAARQHNFSQMDWYNYCECSKCKAMNEQYGTNGGTQFWFVNELAKRTAAVYPDKQIGTLAYQYTEKPPKDLVMHPNVAVWLCHMYPSCDSHSLESCPRNAAYKTNAQGWSQITGHMYVWHYIVNFAHFYEPFPNFGALAKDLRFYHGLGVEGLFLQGMRAAGGGGEFSLLRPWYASKLAWDPGQDADRLVDDFLDGYYGAAATPIRAWIDLLQHQVDDHGIHMHLYTNPAQGFLPDDVVLTGEQLFAEAAALVAGDPELEDRVAVARMPVTYARFFPRNGYRIEDGFLKWNPGMATIDDVQAFNDLMSSHGFTSVRETQGDPSTLILMFTILGVDLPVVTLQNAAIQVDVVPVLGGRALRITDRASGQTVTAYDVRQNLFYPFNGGLEDRIGKGDGSGWVEPAWSDVDGLTVTVGNTSQDGWELTRTYTLDPVLPILRVQSKIRNPGAVPREALLRSHLELDLGDVRQTRMAFTKRSGGRVDEDMTGVIAGLHEGVHFHAEDAPQGEWTFAGTKGLAVTWSFPEAEVDQGWVYAYPETQGEVQAEVWAPPRILQPGESLTVQRTLQVERLPLAQPARSGGPKSGR